MVTLTDEQRIEYAKRNRRNATGGSWRRRGLVSTTSYSPTEAVCADHVLVTVDAMLVY